MAWSISTPEPDTVAEMKVTASSFPADKGVQSGALIEIFTKSGTNKFHGSLSEMHFDNALLARTEFQPSSVPMPKTIRNDFGGTFGGPIFKNKTFFFGSLFWMKSILGGTNGDMLETQDFENYVSELPQFDGHTVFHGRRSRKVRSRSLRPDPSNEHDGRADRSESQFLQSVPPPNIPLDLVAESLVTIITDAINNGFQGHLRIDHNLKGDTDKLFYSMFRNTTQGENYDVRPTYSYINPNSTLYNKVDYLHTFSPKTTQRTRCRL